VGGPTVSHLRFTLQRVDGRARAGVLHTRRGDVPTPVFMPVATHAAFRHVSVDEVGEAGARILLGNTYHLMLRPGREVFERLGGIHRFMGWEGCVLTDSGGYQIFSLPEDREITERGAHFRSFHDNSRQLLSPETSIAMQQTLGSDIMMVLDVVHDARAELAVARDAMERTHRWALRSLEAAASRDSGQALFAIVQGGIHPELRDASVAFLTAHPFHGFAIGGLAVGEEKPDRDAMTARVADQLPADRPRYLMGVGTPLDLVEAVEQGIDMFDCIIPTKMAQQGYAYTFQGLLRATRMAHQMEDVPLDPSCDCFACRRHSRGYLQHLMRGKHALGSRLLSIHNLRHYQVLMGRMREAILSGTLGTFAAEMRALWG
jgi:queuine tRNA-ribosyltransferase